MHAACVHHSKKCPSMTHLGQTRTLDNVRVTSVKLLIADSKRTFSYVRSGPEPDYEATTRIDHRIGDFLFEQEFTGVFRLLIVILIERATTVIDPVAATAAPALLRSYLCFRRFSLTLNFTIFATKPTGIGFSMGNCTAPLEVL